jgi:hypothetical protein
MGRIRNIKVNTGVKGSPQISIYEFATENSISTIQSNQVKDKNKYEIVAENGTYIANNLKYDNNKMETYLLNTNHEKGGSKAKFLSETLGYNKGDGLVLHNNIRNALIDKVPTKITKTPSGLKQEYDIKLVAKDGSIKTAKVVVIVQKDNGTSVYRIITLYPGKKVK